MRRSITRGVVRFFFRDMLWKLLSLAIAVVLWILVASEPELSTFVSVPVQFKDLPYGVEISSELVESVYLELRGPSGALRGGPDARRYAVVLDMSRVRPGEQTFSIDEGQVRLPRGLRLMRAIPAQIRYNFEPRAWRDVPVHVRFSGGDNGVYAVDGFKVHPPTLRVEGPEGRVNRVQAVMTDPIDISRVVGPAEFTVNTFVEDSHIRLVAPSHVTVRVRMKRK